MARKEQTENGKKEGGIHQAQEDAPAAQEVKRLYLDCDGVLADFDRAFFERFERQAHEHEEQHGSPVFWQSIFSVGDFYRRLPLMPGARVLFELVRHHRPIILTGCPRGGWAEMQKLSWARENFPGTPMIHLHVERQASLLPAGRRPG